MARQPTPRTPRSRLKADKPGPSAAQAAEDAALKDAARDGQTLADDAVSAERDALESASLPTATTDIQKAASFNQAQLTAQTGEVLGALESPLADQAAVMMLEDLRGYMQGSEQLVLAASGQAMALLLDPATQDTGKKALQELATWQSSLITFSGSVTSTASTIKTDFSG
ncbi:hypothetical protein [Oceanicaulis sp. HTCC2633]|uniref:hypothetical protein n=1 Tax=Oceanicaulis sp. HTCC2633 TaxID=314254 RepID=UPI0003258109|nr:hypothetical protein [Oceanicaulis sp. HTCC2633]